MPAVQGSSSFSLKGELTPIGPLSSGPSISLALVSAHHAPPPSDLCCQEGWATARGSLRMHCVTGLSVGGEGDTPHPLCPAPRHPQGASIRLNFRAFLLQEVCLTLSPSDSQPQVTLEPCGPSTCQPPMSQSPAKSPLGQADNMISKASLSSLVLPPELFDKTEWSMPPVPWG